MERCGHSESGDMMDQPGGINIVLDALARLERKQDETNKKLDETAQAITKMDAILDERVPAERLSAIEFNIQRLDRESAEVKTKVAPMWAACGVIISTVIHWLSNKITGGGP